MSQLLKKNKPYICIYTVIKLCFLLSATETPEVFTVIHVVITMIAHTVPLICPGAALVPHKYLKAPKCAKICFTQAHCN